MSNLGNITPIDKYVIDFVKTLRVAKNLTQEDIGNIIGVSRSFIRDVEGNKNRAKFNIHHINALGDYFGMSPRAFLPEKAFPIDAPAKEKSSRPKRPTIRSKKKIKK